MNALEQKIQVGTVTVYLSYGLNHVYSRPIIQEGRTQTRIHLLIREASLDVTYELIIRSPGPMRV